MSATFMSSKRNEVYIKKIGLAYGSDRLCFWNWVRSRGSCPQCLGTFSDDVASSTIIVLDSFVELVRYFGIYDISRSIGSVQRNRVFRPKMKG